MARRVIVGATSGLVAGLVVAVWVSFFGHVLYGAALGIGVWSETRSPVARPS